MEEGKVQKILYLAMNFIIYALVFIHKTRENKRVILYSILLFPFHPPKADVA